jgi:hypothetical protein
MSSASIVYEYHHSIAMHAANSIQTVKEPLSYAEAVTGPQAKDWLRAVAEELDSHKVNNTWTHVRTAKGQKVIGCKWVFKVKRDQDGNISRYKARLTAKGYSQTHGVDYNETFAPTVRFATMRIFFAITAAHNWTMSQLDVKTAYLIPKLTEDIYMKTPQGLTHDGGCVKLNKSLYGLKQASREWSGCLHEALTNQCHLTRSELDPCLYFKMENGTLVGIVIVYVDDILIGGTDEQVTEVSKNLRRQFNMTENDVGHFLGIRVERNKDGTILLTQDAYVDKLLTTFDMQECATRNTPAGEILKAGTPQPEGEEQEEIPEYRRLLGALQYLSITTRPDITFAVNQAARFCQRPTRDHLTAAKRILRYLKATKHFGLKYEPVRKKDGAASTIAGHSSFRFNERGAKCVQQTNEAMKQDALRGFADADWATDTSDRKSQSGYVFMVYGGAVSWRSKKQPTIATSSCEAEIISLSMSMKEALWLRMLMTELKLINPDEPTKVFEDNQGAKALVSDPKFSDRSKHIDIQFLRIREEIRNKKLVIPYCSTKDMLADMFTKPLGPQLLYRNIENMRMSMKDYDPTQKREIGDGITALVSKQHPFQEYRKWLGVSRLIEGAC